MLLALLLALAQTPTLSGAWVGPLELTVQAPEKKRGPLPTVVDLKQTGSEISGSWRSLPPNTATGLLTGTVKPSGEVTLRVTFYADLHTGEPERCEADAEMKGLLTVSGVLRLTAKRAQPSTRPQRTCGPWPTDLVWQLQRH
jgi:hypothetical protein